MSPDQERDFALQEHRLLRGHVSENIATLFQAERLSIGAAAAVGAVLLTDLAEAPDVYRPVIGLLPLGLVALGALRSFGLYIVVRELNAEIARLERLLSPDGKVGFERSRGGSRMTRMILIEGLTGVFWVAAFGAAAWFYFVYVVT